MARLGPAFEWPVIKQVRERDPAGLGEPAFSKRTFELLPRTRTADKVTRSVCPFCAVGCGQNVYVKDGRITDIEGDPESPISLLGFLVFPDVPSRKKPRFLTPSDHSFAKARLSGLTAPPQLRLS